MLTQNHSGRLIVLAVFTGLFAAGISPLQIAANTDLTANPLEQGFVTQPDDA